MSKFFKNAVVLTASVILGIISCGCGVTAANRTEQSVAKTTTHKESDMTKVEREYNAMLEDPETFPINFVYDNKYYKGFSPKHFKKLSQTEKQVDGGTQTTTVFNFKNELDVTLISAVYPEYDAYDYTVYFENTGNKNSGVIRELNAVDIEFDCESARLKGIYGDWDHLYEPYDFDLCEKPVNFKSTRGRASHTLFPYFNLEAKGNGTLLAIGWDGTWKADFAFDKEKKNVRYTGTGTVDLCTYLKPGERIRTPLMAFVRYYGADEDAAMNMWRKWYIDCNMPYEDGGKTEKVQSHLSIFIGLDTQKFNGADGSITEDKDTWYRSMKKFYDNGGKADFRWLDAGWYSDPYGNTVPSDWWGTVGTWEFDEVKWGGGAIEECTAYCEEHGTKTLLWFEPERVTHIDRMVSNYGYRYEWALSEMGNNNAYLHNLGIDEARKWVLNRIINAMERSGASLYREDFNIDPAIYWNIGDGYQGDNRKGITENLYMQGHYKLWDEIIEWGAQNGKCTYLDDCASGGGRLSLESMRRSVPLNRSDADRTTTSLSLAITTTLTKWIPYARSSATEAAEAVTDTAVGDSYVFRTRMLPWISLSLYNGLDYAAMVKGVEEWDEYKRYFFKDFYTLTPYRGINCTTEWTAYMFFDADDDSGVITAVRPAGCDRKEFTVNVKGVSPNRYYSVRDVDGKQSIARVKGSALMQGLRITSEHDRSAFTLYIERAE